MTKKETVAVYIDGGNLYRRLKDFNIPKNKNRFNYLAFIKYLVGDRGIVSKRYYIGTVKNVDGSKKSEKMVRGQQKFLDGIEREGFEIKRGKIMYDEGNIREKGVDVKLATDLISNAINNKYDMAILVSNDSDFVPAIKEVQKIGKQVWNINFPKRKSFHLNQICNKRITINTINPFQTKEK